MLGRQERTAILLLLGVAAVVIAAHGLLMVLGKQPFSQPFTNSSKEGELVFFNGTIEQAMLTKNGGHVTLRIRNISVFIPSQAAQGFAFQKGQQVALYGIVETYRGEKEIVVSSSDDIRIG